MNVPNYTANKYMDVILRHYNAAGTEITNFVSITQANLGTARNTVTGLGVSCNSGDYFQVELLLETDTSVDISTISEFTILLRGQ